MNDERVVPVVRVTGVPSRAKSSWCLEVTEEEFTRLLGEAGAEQERESKAVVKGFGIEYPWRIYPHQLLRRLGIEEGQNDTVTLEIRLLPPQRPE